MSKFFFYFLLLIQLLIVDACFAQAILKLPFEKKIGPDDGLSSYNANKILEDRYGFIWIATQDGLNRYDGKQFTIYNKSTVINHRLLGNAINDIVQDTVRNILWVTTSYGGVNGIDLTTGNIVHELKCVIGDSSFHNGWLKCFSICQGKLWIGTSAGLTVYDPDKRVFVHIEALPFKKDSITNQLNINSVATDRFNNIWIYLPSYGIVLYTGATNKVLRYFTNDQLGIKETQEHIQLLCRFQSIDKNTYVLGTDHGLNFLGYDSTGRIWKLPQTIVLNNLLKNKNIFSCTSDNNGALWFSTPDNLYKYDLKNGKYEIVEDIGRKGQDNWLSTILYIFFDGHNNLWLGSGKGISFSKNIMPSFIPYSQSKDAIVKINHAIYVYPVNDSIIYVCGTNGFYEVKTTTDDILQLASYATNYVFRNVDNKYIISSSNGLLVQESGRLYPVKNIYPELFLLSNENINSSIIIGDSLVIMASETEKGIYIWHFKKHILDHFPMKDDNIENTPINYIYKNSKNQVLILFDNSIAVFDLHKYNYKRFQINDPELKIPLSILFDICEVKNYYWLAIYGKGVMQMDQNFKIKKTYSLNNGLLNTGVYKVMPYRDSLIFVTSNNGLYAINIESQKVNQYLKDDGLNTNNFEERCGYIKDDIFFAGGSNGFSSINPSLMRNYSNTSSLYIDNFKLQLQNKFVDTFNLNFQKYTIPNNTLQTTISFSALHYTNPERVTYAYKIDELNNNWIDLGTQNFISLIGLSPGTYTLEVKAANEDGVWCEPKTLKLTFLPKWYQTWWFDLLVGFSVASLLYGFYRYRLMQLHKQHQIRKEIAEDLHDDIGATLNSVKIFTHLAETSAEKKKYFTNIKEALTQASVGLRDMIWVLDDAGDTAEDLLKRLQMFAHPVAEASGISISFIADDAARDTILNKTEKRNLLLIAKEAINNSIKYAESKNITVTFSKLHNKNVLTVEDDGKGFSQNKITPGNGLNNIQQRAHQVHYNITLESEEGKGTKITAVKR